MACDRNNVLTMCDDCVLRYVAEIERRHVPRPTEPRMPVSCRK